LIVGFTVGWSNIAPWVSTGNNVDTIALACEVACSTNSVYDYCTTKRELNNGTGTLDETCNTFARNYPQYKIANCTKIQPC